MRVAGVVTLLSGVVSVAVAQVSPFYVDLDGCPQGGRKLKTTTIDDLDACKEVCGEIAGCLGGTFNEDISECIVRTSSAESDCETDQVGFARLPCEWAFLDESSPFSETCDTASDNWNDVITRTSSQWEDLLSAFEEPSSSRSTCESSLQPLEYSEVKSLEGCQAICLEEEQCEGVQYSSDADDCKVFLSEVESRPASSGDSACYVLPARPAYDSCAAAVLMESNCGVAYRFSEDGTCQCLERAESCSDTTSADTFATVVRKTCVDDASVSPSVFPTPLPTPKPTKSPTPKPTKSPTKSPTRLPTVSPTPAPSTGATAPPVNEVVVNPPPQTSSPSEDAQEPSSSAGEGDDVVGVVLPVLGGVVGLASIGAALRMRANKSRQVDIMKPPGAMRLSKRKPSPHNSFELNSFELAEEGIYSTGVADRFTKFIPAGDPVLNLPDVGLAEKKERRKKGKRRKSEMKHNRRPSEVQQLHLSEAAHQKNTFSISNVI